jgi:hypothetical protein
VNRLPVEDFSLVLLDVNGTLIPSGSRGRWDSAYEHQFSYLVGKLATRGIDVGLCSDSPLEQLWRFGHDIGLRGTPHFPAVAENGNVVAIDGEISIFAPFPAREHIEEFVELVAAELGLHRTADVSAPEFGGTVPAEGQWGFGQNRRASVSIFGPPNFVDQVRCRLIAWSGINDVCASIRLSSDQSYAVIHPYSCTEIGKRRAVARLTERESALILMVGNAIADWIPGVEGVRCAFVADAAPLPAEVQESAVYCSPRPDLGGVIDILYRVIGYQLPQGRRSPAERR